jgi:hypothetical protein
MAQAGIGAGELAMALIGVGTGVLSPFSPLLSLFALLSSLSLESLVPVLSLLTSSAKAPLRPGWYVGTCHRTPVKLRTWNPFFSHRRHFAPDLSRARRRSLMAPRFALGPALLMAAGAGKGPLELGSLIMSPIFFLFGPGLALGCLGVAPFAPASICAALRLLPGLGPFLFAAAGASDEGVPPFMLGVESAGVAAGDGSTICGAGVGGEGLASSLGGVAGWCGNLLSESGESLSATMSVFCGFVVMFACRGTRRRWTWMAEAEGW